LNEFFLFQVSSAEQILNQIHDLKVHIMLLHQAEIQEKLSDSANAPTEAQQPTDMEIEV
jgi:hypothetical protein